MRLPDIVIMFWEDFLRPLWVGSFVALIALAFMHATMFRGFLLLLWIGTFVAVIALAFMVVSLKWLLGLTMRRGEARVLACLTMRRGEARWPPLTHAVGGLAAAAQFYFWGLWAAYCAALAVSRVTHPEVTHAWLYYAVAFQFVVTPIALSAATELEVAKELAAKELAAKERAVESAIMFYRFLTIVVFVVFVFWPGLMRAPYGWAIDVLGVGR